MTDNLNALREALIGLKNKADHSGHSLRMGRSPTRRFNSDTGEEYWTEQELATLETSNIKMAAIWALWGRLPDIIAALSALPDGEYVRARELADRLANHVQSHGGPAKDENGAYIGTVWPMMLEAAELLRSLSPAPAKGET